MTANGKNLATLTADDAMAFANHLAKHRSKTIRKFLKGVQIEAHYSRIAANISPAAKAALDAEFRKLAAAQRELNDLGPRRAKIKAKVQKAEKLKDKKKIVGQKRNKNTLKDFKEARRNANTAKAKINQIVSTAPSKMKPIKTIARGGFKALVIVDIFDMAQSLKYGEQYVSYQKAVFKDQDGSQYTARQEKDGWFGKKYSITYVKGPKKGITEKITSKQYGALKKTYHQVYGEYIPFRSPVFRVLYWSPGWFKPGTKRKTLPVFTWDQQGRVWNGHVDEKGWHWGPKPDNWGKSDRDPWEGPQII